MEEIIKFDEIKNTMDLMWDLFEMNSVAHSAALAACFNVVCIILQSRGLPEETILELANKFEACVEQVSGKIFADKNTMEGK